MHGDRLDICSMEAQTGFFRDGCLTRNDRRVEGGAPMVSTAAWVMAIFIRAGPAPPRLSRHSRASSRA